MATPAPVNNRINRLRSESKRALDGIIGDLSSLRDQLANGGSPYATRMPMGRIAEVYANLAALSASVDAVEDYVVAEKVNA